MENEFIHLVRDPSEYEKSDNVGVLVSINCITYNHENYIADAIESFLMQKTNFEL